MLSESDRLPANILLGSRCNTPTTIAVCLILAILSIACSNFKAEDTALTVYAAEFDQQQALQAGFQRHLAKPVEPEILIREIADLLEQKS